MTMQMMKTTASTGPTTHMSPSPVSKGRGSGPISGVITVSVYGLVANIFCAESNEKHGSITFTSVSGNSESQKTNADLPL